MKKFSEDDFVLLYYEPDSPHAIDLREKLKASPEMQAEYEAFAELLDQMKETESPALSPHEKVEQFETAWAKAAPGASPWYVGAFNSLWKTSTVFILGMICGVVVTMKAPVQPQPDAKINASKSSVLDVTPVNNPLVIEQFDAFQTVRGEALNKVYSNIEDPVLVIDSSDPKGEKKVIHGTSENGAIQVVLNL